MIERHELYDPDLLLDYLLRVNNMLSQREMKMWELMVGRKESNYVRSEETKREANRSFCGQGSLRTRTLDLEAG